MTPADKLPVDKIKLPAGFKAEVWSSGHPGARTMVEGPKGTIFMGTRQLGRVYAITNKDGKREVKTLLQGLTQPNGLAVKDGALYVLAINKVFRFDNIEDNLDKPGTGVELTDKFNLPDTIHHNWKYADFGPDGKLYIQVGANCNICEINNGIHGQIRRYNADGSGMEIVARGVRNTVGFDWHPVTKELWFTDNGRDWAGNAGPEDELNVIAKGKEGAFYRLPVLPRQRHCRSGRQDSESLRRRDVAGRDDRTALRGPGHQVLHRQHVPQELPERRVHRAARLLEPGAEVRLRRGRGADLRRQGQARAVHDRPARREGQCVPRPADLRPSDEGRLAAGVGRAERRDLSHHLSGEERQPVDAVVMEFVCKYWRPLVLGLAAAVLSQARRSRRPRRSPSASQTCDACHGEDGNSKMENIPSLAGQPAFFILNQLILMREKVRPVEAMAPFVKDLKDDDIRALAEHFAKLPPKPSDEPIDPALVKRGEEIANASAAAPAMRRIWPDRSRSRASPSSASTI